MLYLRFERLKPILRSVRVKVFLRLEKTNKVFFIMYFPVGYKFPSKTHFAFALDFKLCRYLALFERLKKNGLIT